MPGNIGWTGALVIVLVLLLVFGPKRLPEMGRSLGRGLREFKDAVTGKVDEDERAELPPSRVGATTSTTSPSSQPSETERVSS